MPQPISRRTAVARIAGASASLLAVGADAESKLRVAPFAAEVTPPPGHALMGGGIQPARKVEDPLFVHGLVFLGAGDPLVLAVADWCEIRNDAHDRWRSALAGAAGTTPARVLVSAVHQHDTPIADLTAEKLLREAKAKGSVCDPEFHEQAVQRVARAVKAALPNARRVTHLETGQARVERIASNRRYLDDAGKPHYNRMSATRDVAIRDRPEGTIDPFLKTLAFLDGDTPVATLAVYATHPMSYYGQGGVSADFVGMARKRRQTDGDGGFYFYASGCSGNVTAGKFNDGSPGNRPVLADRLYRAMKAASEGTKRHALQTVGFRKVPLPLKPREGDGYSLEALRTRLTSDARPFGQCLAALGLSWRHWLEQGNTIDLPVLDFGPALLLLLPGEAYVEYQLLAQQLRPDRFVVTLGYGQSATGYIPIERAIRENDSNLHDWCWVAPGSEAVMNAALREALRA